MTKTEILSEYLANLSFEALPKSVVDYTKSLTLDWLGSALAGKGQHPTDLFIQFSKMMGPDHGSSRVLSDQSYTSPYFAALINGASSHLVEQDDLHNQSVFHPATVVFPAVLAAAEDLHSTGKEFITAVVAGYEAGIRIATFLGRSHYKVFHTTATVGSLSAAIAVGKLLNFNQAQFIQVIGNAGTQVAGLWAFLQDAADSKQLHTAKANANGVLSAYMTQSGLTGAKNILESEQGLAAGMSSDAEPNCLIDRLNERWAILETSFKFHASCRHTHPAADALLLLMQQEKLIADDIQLVQTHVHQAAIDVLGNVTIPNTIHQAKFSMGTVLALIALYGKAGILEFNNFALQEDYVAAFRDKVEMVYDEAVDAAYPTQWIGKVSVSTKNGRIFSLQIDYPKGDPENTLTKTELEDKFRELTAFSNACTKEEANRMITDLWQLETLPTMRQAFLI